MKLPSLKIILINIIYWTCVAIVTIISTTIVTYYAWKAKNTTKNVVPTSKIKLPTTTTITGNDNIF